MTKPTIRRLWPAKTQISLCVHVVWSESSLIACVLCSHKATERGINENPCPTGWIYGLNLRRAYLFEVVFVKCVCIWRTSVFFQFYWAPVWPFDLKWACCCQYSYTFEFFHYVFFFFVVLRRRNKRYFSLFTIGNMHSQIERIISWFNNTV